MISPRGTRGNRILASIRRASLDSKAPAICADGFRATINNQCSRGRSADNETMFAAFPFPQLPATAPPQFENAAPCPKCGKAPCACPSLCPRCGKAPCVCDRLDTVVELSFSADRNGLFTAWNAIANLADMAGKVAVTIRAEADKGFDKSKVQNGVLEPLREADLID